MTMRIGIDGRALQERYPTGVSIFTFYLLRALWNLTPSCEYEIFCNGWHRHCAPLLSTIYSETPSHVTWRFGRLPNKIFTAASILRTGPSVRWMFGDVDVVLLPSLDFVPPSLWRVPSVLVVHDVASMRMPEVFQWKERLRHRLIRPQWSMQSARALIAVSTHTKKEMMQYVSIAQEKIHVIFPGRITPICTDIVPRPYPQPYIVSLGTVEARKNVDTLLSAWKNVRVKYPHHKLVIAGAQTHYAHTLMRKTADSSIIWRGYITDTEKIALLRYADVLVYPSLYEGFGFPPLEAQAVNVPVIASPYSSLSEVLGDSAMLTDTCDVYALTNAIDVLLRDTKMRSIIQTRGMQNVARWKWEDTARNVLALLTEVASIK